MMLAEGGITFRPEDITLMEADVIKMIVQQRRKIENEPKED